MFLKDSVIKMAEGSKIHVGVDGLHADLAKTGIPSVYLSIVATERIFNVNGQPIADSYWILCVLLAPACSAQNMGPKAVGMLVIGVSKRED